MRVEQQLSSYRNMFSFTGFLIQPAPTGRFQTRIQKQKGGEKVAYRRLGEAIRQDPNHPQG